jgi:hypothetical protein
MKSTFSYRKSSPAILLIGLFAISGCNPERFLFEDTSVAASLPDSTMVVLLTGVDFRHVDGQKIGTFFYDEGDAWPEQGNFDLCEIYRRQFMDRIRQGNKLGTLIWSIRAKWKAKRGRYESETNGGLDFLRQAEWTAKIHRALVYGTDTANTEFKVH